MVNCNEETGIPFGIISSNEMSQWVVDDLMYTYGTNVSDQEALKEAREEFLRENLTEEEWDALETSEFEEKLEELGWDDHNLWDSYQTDEPYIYGEHEGVKYETSWLGGALNFVIISSPYITDKANKGSPCVPNMGVLDTLDGDYQCYDVPADWRWTEDG